jgi:hypothetical protein
MADLAESWGRTPKKARRSQKQSGRVAFGVVRIFAVNRHFSSLSMGG